MSDWSNIGRYSWNGFTLENPSEITKVDISFTNCTLSNQVSPIKLNNLNVNISNCQFLNNTAGALFGVHATFQIHNSTFEGNSVNGTDSSSCNDINNLCGGAAVLAFYSDFTVSGSKFLNNFVFTRDTDGINVAGGALQLTEFSTIKIDSSVFIGNYVSVIEASYTDGDSIYVTALIVEITNSVFEGFDPTLTKILADASISIMAPDENYSEPNITIENVIIRNLHSNVLKLNYLNGVKMENLTISNISVVINDTFIFFNQGVSIDCNSIVMKNMNVTNTNNLVITIDAYGAEISNSTFAQNSVLADQATEGLLNLFTPIVLIDTKFVQNNGYSVIFYDQLNVSNCLFENNLYTPVYLYSPTELQVSIDNCSFVNNQRSAIEGYFSFPNDQGPTNASISNSYFQSNTGAILMTSDTPSFVHLEIANCDFYNNSNVDGGALYLEAINTTISNCRFIKNRASGYGGAIYIKADMDFDDNSYISPNVSYVFTGNYFSESYAQVGGAIYGSLINHLEANLAIEDSVFTFSAASLGGVMAFSSEVYFNATVRIHNCTIENSTAQNGGILYATEYVGIEISSSTLQNSSSQLGGAIYADSVALQIEDSLVLDCYATFSGGAVFISSNDLAGFAKISFSNLTFANDSSPLGSGGAVSISTLSSVPILMTGCHFENNSALSFGGAIYSTANSKPSINDSTFLYNSANQGGAIYVDIQSQPIFQSTNFSKNNAVSDGGAAAFYGNARAVFVNVTFDSNNGTNGGAVLVTTLANASFSDCQFINNIANLGNGGAVYATTSAQAAPTFLNCVFSSNEAQSGGGFAGVSSLSRFKNCAVIKNRVEVNGGGVFLSGASNVQLEQVEFSSNLAVGSGGGFHCEGNSFFIMNDTKALRNIATQGGAINSEGKCTPNISLSIFANNNASASGGAMFVQSNSFFLSESNFTENLATNGAGIYMSSGMDSSKSLFANNTFINGTASIAGGAFFWDLSDREIQSFNTTSTAEKYAPKCTSCFFAGNSASYGNTAATNPSTIFFTKIPESLQLSNNAAIGPFQIGAVDFYNQTILGSSYRINVGIVSNTIGDTPLLLGTTESVLSNGTALIPQIQIGGSFYHEYTLIFSLVGPLLGNISTLNITITYPGCTAGQGGVTSNFDTCKDCSAGTYNLNGNGTCLPCPANAICEGKSNVVANDDYYLVVQNETADTYSCPEGYCENGGCGSHRSGLLCGTCDSGYQPSYGSCLKCDKSYEPSAVFGDLVLLWIYVIALQFSSKLPNQKFDDGRYVVSGLVKIILFYLQTVSLVFTHKQGLQRLFGFFNFQFFVPFSDQCSVKLDFFGTFMLAIFMPLILVGILFVNLALQFLVWVILKKFSPRLAEYTKLNFSTFPRTICSIVIFTYSHVVLAVFTLVICRNVGPNRVVAASPDISCSTSKYKHWSTFAYFIFVYIALVPVIVAYLDRSHKKKKQSNVFSENFGVLFQCFKDDKYYWEIVILVRRLLFIMIYSVSFAEPAAKYLALMIFAVLVLIHHLFASPYFAKIENLLETALLSILAILAGIQNAEANGVYRDQMKTFSTVVAYFAIIPICFGVHCIVQDVLFRHGFIRIRRFVPDDGAYEAVRVRSEPDLSSARSF